MQASKRVYLDNSATSWPKPDEVYAAVDRYQREIGAAAGRGAYREAVEAQRIVDAARQGCAKLLGENAPERIIFAANGTDALNLAIHGLLHSGDHVVTTVCEHNSVLRPLADAALRLDIEVSHVGCNSAGYVDPQEVKRAMRPHTRLVAVVHASNVTGAIQPVQEIADIARAAGALMLVDAAQTVGHFPLAVYELGADLLAASGHKGLLGPFGTAFLWIKPGIEKRLAPTRQGGTGHDSGLAHQPEELPFRYEAGNLNTAALAGLSAATRFLVAETIEAIQSHEHRITRLLIDGMLRIPGVRVYGPLGDEPRAAVVAFSVDGYDPQDFAVALDSSFGVQCRAGLHCAPRIHAALGTTALGGLIRVSPGWATTDEDAERALHAITALAAV